MIRLLLSGACGRMGRAVAALCEGGGEFSVLCGVDAHPDAERLPFPVLAAFDECPPCDCIVDFSSPVALPELLSYAVRMKTPAVLATTGYAPPDHALIREAAQEIPLLVSGNLSRGMQAVRKLTGELTTLLDGFDVEIVEAHHGGKTDAPSGTALLLCSAVREARGEGPFRVVCDRRGGLSPRQPGDVGISSVRAGGLYGVHSVLFASQDEAIELRHTALSRRCFAEGALDAARFLLGQKAGVYADILSG